MLWLNIHLICSDDPVEQLVKQGSISFTPTAQGTPVKPPPTICSAGIDYSWLCYCIGYLDLVGLRGGGFATLT